ncbi:SLAIN motif-containing protein-like isoform X1 [Bufo gargarizans]|uniref:SLAIN motif-containing protein-like isoform X1 n=1 Tax=Bufo gargarizans TaxID=30331 RepID=UPI001CF22D3F|nr:SLAIN motif-containing protein-like isoform X1 [Bufo gargarizans]XP_044161779.1 SLAIN motif-containing protein-like isoform X1 [Bufo gargarizans]XP_044161780.1 SLAIN motif-containing protein-like isoform X1 [Bufo gargarizans]
MVVPESSPGIQHDRMRVASNSIMDGETDAGSDLTEVRKLHELVRRLEIQNQQLRVKKNSQGTSNEPGMDTYLSTLQASGVMNSMNIQPEVGDLEIIPDLHSKLDQIHSEKENIPRLRMEKLSSSSNANSKEGSHCDADDSAFFSLDVSGRTEEGMGKMSERSSSGDLGVILDETALDDVEVLELGSCSEDEEDCWLYVSPKKLEIAEQKPDSPLKWCRQVLDHHSPETEAACRTLMGKLDQAGRWKSLYCSPLASPSAYSANNETSCCSNTLNSPGCLKSTNKPLLTCGSSGYMSVPSALSSQSSVDSELSTSDDSISMGYKLQDLTDVQVMARLQEESLRQDYASSSASVSRRSSSASLNSFRRGTFSDQEFDTYSLEDDEDCDCSVSYRSANRYSPSPLSSPRCQSPSATGESSKSSISRLRPPRRSMQNQAQDRMKYPGFEDDLRHSMPNLAKTSLRSLEAVRSSRSLESDLQGPSGRLTRIQPPAGNTPPSKLRYSSGSSHPAGARPAVKASLSTSSLMNSRQPVKSSGYNGSGGVRKMSSPCLAPVVPGVSRTSNLSPSVKHSGVKSQLSSGNSTPKSKMVQPSKRSLNSSRTNPPDDDSWKEGCY